MQLALRARNVRFASLQRSLRPLAMRPYGVCLISQPVSNYHSRSRNLQGDVSTWGETCNTRFSNGFMEIMIVIWRTL